MQLAVVSLTGEGTEDAKPGKPGKYKGFRQQGNRVRPQSRETCSPVQQALIRFFYKHSPFGGCLFFLRFGTERRIEAFIKKLTINVK
jgi:hypothetical protein